MITTPLTVEELTSLFIETFVNKQDKVTEVSDGSVLSGISFAVGKIAQKAVKDIAIVESIMFPENATGTNLDKSAEFFGAPLRNEEIGSSVGLLLRADEGTEYLASTHKFTSDSGIVFSLDTNYTVDETGYIYAHANSDEVGSITNVSAQTINKISESPIGHLAVTNEYAATGGLDNEEDEMYRLRIKQHPNIQAKGTLAYILEICRIFNPYILRVMYYGISELGYVQIGVLQQNGANLTQEQLDNLQSNVSPYLPLCDISVNSNYGLKFVNPYWLYVDVDFRVDIDSAYLIDDVRTNIQIAMTKYLDFRYWDYNKLIEWDEFHRIVKSTGGVLSCPINYFSPQSSNYSKVNEIPRMRGFIMRDLDGTVIVNTDAVLPVYFEQ